MYHILRFLFFAYPLDGLLVVSNNFDALRNVDHEALFVEHVDMPQGLDGQAHLIAYLIAPCVPKISSAALITTAVVNTPSKRQLRLNTKCKMVKRKVAALEKIDADFASLQYKIRRDPKSYKEEFLKQWEQYESQREIFLVSPGTATADSVESFHNIIDLIAHVADCYPEETRAFPDDLKAILTQHHVILHPELREKIVGSLGLLRRKDVIDSVSVLTTLFPILVSSPSKTLREQLFQKILSDMRNSNSKSINHPLNRTIQTVLYNLVTADRASPRAIWAIKLTRELWKRQIWTDSKPVDVMKEACLSENEKVVVGAVRFFLGGDKEREEIEDESSDEEVDLAKVKHQIGINKKTKKQKRVYDKAVAQVKRAERKKSKPHPLNFSALHLLHDPQGFAEQLFSKHLQNTKAKLSLDTKLLVLQLVTRLIGLHKLTVVSLYSWFIKFLTPRQQSVTSFLASLAQATHNLVPPDVLEPLVQKIANEFVSEAAAGEVAAAGLNSIREICARQPLAMSDTLLQDLVQYRKSKDKGVMMAAKGLLSLYREVGAELLKKKDRGKDATIGLKSGSIKQRRYGEEAIGQIEGLELLAKYKEEERKRKRLEKGLPETAGSDEENKDGDDGFDSDEWEVGSEDSSDSGEWINVDHSDDEAPALKKRKQGDGGSDEDSEDDSEEAKAEREAEMKRISELATTTILTPADLAKLQELRTAAAIENAAGVSRRKRQQEQENRHADDGLTAENIEAPAKLRKLTKEEKVALAREGKPDREEHKSTQAIRKSKKEAAGKSTSNREKQRKKNFLMTLGKAKGKQKRSLVQARKVLRGHVERSTRGGRRRNGM
ncbi:Protein SDA1 [Paramyrothecium foliicola]|nr:Protein SDA1 [Paramyrothecium foliicola]